MERKLGKRKTQKEKGYKSVTDGQKDKETQ